MEVGLKEVVRQAINSTVVDPQDRVGAGTGSGMMGRRRSSPLAHRYQMGTWGDVQYSIYSERYGSHRRRRIFIGPAYEGLTKYPNVYKQIPNCGKQVNSGFGLLLTPRPGTPAPTCSLAGAMMTRTPYRRRPPCP
jgi:hypothetical protein